MPVDLYWVSDIINELLDEGKLRFIDWDHLDDSLRVGGEQWLNRSSKATS